MFQKKAERTALLVGLTLMLVSGPLKVLRGVAKMSEMRELYKGVSAREWEVWRTPMKDSAMPGPSPCRGSASLGAGREAKRGRRCQRRKPSDHTSEPHHPVPVAGRGQRARWRDPGSSLSGCRAAWRSIKHGSLDKWEPSRKWMSQHVGLS